MLMIIIWVCKLLTHLVNLSKPHLWKRTDEKKQLGTTKVLDKLFLIVDKATYFLEF